MASIKLAALLAIVISVACAAEGRTVLQTDTTAPTSILAAAQSAPSTFSTLVTAATAANLTGPLNDTNTAWTVFAPTNAAFEATLAALNITLEELASNKELLTTILSYHVVPVVARAENLVTNASLPTLLAGQNLTVASLRPNVTIQGALTDVTVVTADIVAGKSIIHAIDGVLIPDLNTSAAPKIPATLHDVISTTPDVSLLGQALAAANLTDVLKNPNTTWTVFAPTNKALESALSTLKLTPEALLADKALLSQVLSYHVVPDVAATASMLKANQILPTLLTNSTLTVSTISPKVTITGVANTVTVTTADVKAGTSIVHLIDGVLLPPALKQKVAAAAGPTPSPSTPAPAAPAAAPAPAPKTSGATALATGVAAAAAAAMGCLLLAI